MELMINEFNLKIILYPWNVFSLLLTHILYTPVQTCSLWNIHYTDHRSHRSLSAIHHLKLEPAARFVDGCVNFSKSQSAAKDSTMECGVFHLLWF